MSRTLALLTLAAAGMLSACAPLVLGSAMVGGALVVTDRRTSGTQLEDQAIELKAASRIRSAVGDRGHINVTSYNRVALLTGEAGSEADRAAIEQAVRGIENLRSVVNEIAVMGNSSMTSRSNDTIVTARVKTAVIEATDLPANITKVVTERGTVYLMGRVTEREAQRVSNIARNVSGVLKVVRLFEILTEAELAAITPGGVAKPASK